MYYFFFFFNLNFDCAFFFIFYRHFVLLTSFVCILFYFSRENTWLGSIAGYHHLLLYLLINCGRSVCLFLSQNTTDSFFVCSFNKQNWYTHRRWYTIKWYTVLPFGSFGFIVNKDGFWKAITVYDYKIKLVVDCKNYLIIHFCVFVRGISARRMRCMCCCGSVVDHMELGSNHIYIILKIYPGA